MHNIRHLFAAAPGNFLKTTRPARPLSLHRAIHTEVSSQNSTKLWKWSNQVGLGLLGALATAAVSGAFFQAISTKRDAKKFPPIGKLVEIDTGIKMHLHITGSGGPTVILAAGMGCNSLSWSLVQAAIDTQVVSFDRPGNGWSDESPTDRTSQNIVTELDLALQKANIPGPYILVGHSFGGLNMQEYARRFPHKVCGMILVDSSNPDQADQIEPPKMNHSLAMLASRLGIVRLLMHLPAYKKQVAVFPEPIQEMLLSQLRATKFMKTVLRETAHLKTSYEPFKSAGKYLGDTPLTVISAMKTMPAKGSGYTQEQIDAFHLLFQDLQKDLVTKSTKGKQVFATESDHMIPYHQPKIIVDSIKEMIDSYNR